MDSQFVKDKEEKFSIYVVKEESHDQFDNKVVVLSQVEYDFSDEISEDILDCSHNFYRSYEC